LQPTQPELRYELARVLRRLNRPAEAMDCLQAALSASHCAPPLRVLALQLLALLHSDAGALSQALEALDAALLLAPERAPLHHNRAVLLQRLARHAESLQAHERALSLGLDVADAHYNLGNTLQSLRREQEALAAYRAALARDAQHELALFDVARLRWRLGHADFTAELDAAAARAPGSPLAPGIKARLLLRADRYAEAAASYAAAAERAPAVASYHDGLGQSLLRDGRYPEALQAHRRAVQLAPGDVSARFNLALALLYAGEPVAAEAEAQEAVRMAPEDQQAWATLGLIWRALGDPREAWLNDYERHVQVFDLVPQPAWGDSRQFNADLAAALERMHTDTHAPIDQTLRHGSQTNGRLFDDPEPLLQQLRSLIAPAIDGYVASLSAQPSQRRHPLLGTAGPRWRFTDSWSSRLRGGGFHTRHLHPHGWISSCYYVALPDALGTGASQDGEAAQAGWITFGAPALAAPRGAEFAVRRSVQPAVGRLVLFPSYMWHGTVPFPGTDRRLTVAFDVVPDP